MLMVYNKEYTCLETGGVFESVAYVIVYLLRIAYLVCVGSAEL